MNKYYTKNGVFEGERYDISWGQLHREDGPTVEYENGDKYWYYNGRLHRLEGPAIEYKNGNKIWYKDGKRHREDGPAVEYVNGDKIYWINYVYCSPSKFYSHNEVVEYLHLDSIIIPSSIKDLIQEYKTNNSNDIFQVIQDYFLENNLLTNSTYSDILFDVITYYNFK